MHKLSYVTVPKTGTDGATGCALTVTIAEAVGEQAPVTVTVYVSR